MEIKKSELDDYNSQGKQKEKRQEVIYLACLFLLLIILNAIERQLVKSLINLFSGPTSSTCPTNK